MTGEGREVVERAPGKVNLLLHVGAPRPDGLHPLCSLFAPVELADTVTVTLAGTEDAVTCPGIEGENLAARALASFRAAVPTAELGPLRIAIEKRIPVAAGMAGGSADAAAVLRATNELAGRPSDVGDLRRLGAALGSDVASQIEPRAALVTGTGERVEPVSLAPLALVLVPQRQGLATSAVYAELDRLRGAGAVPPRAETDVEAIRALAASSTEQLAVGAENDLEVAALSLRPELAGHLAQLHERGALRALVTGSGPTVFGIFEHRRAAEAASSAIPGSIVTSTL